MGHQSSPIQASSGRARLPAVGRKQNHPTTRRYVGDKTPTHPKVLVREGIKQPWQDLPPNQDKKLCIHTKPLTPLVPEEMPRTLAEVNNLRHTTLSALTELVQDRRENSATLRIGEKQHAITSLAIHKYNITCGEIGQKLSSKAR